MPIEFTANKTLQTISYSLDGADNITVTGNFSVPNVSNGYHNLTVYATDEAGNISSQTVNFTVEKPWIEFVSVTIVVGVVLVAAVCLILGIVIFRRQRKTDDFK